MSATTARIDRDEAKHAYSVFLSSCPAHQLLETLGNKWVALVICALQDSPRRHAELRRIIAGVSQKMLTTTLRGLERDGILDRQVSDDVPVRVEYRLTELGRSLLPVIWAMKTWAETNMDEVLDSRSEHDGNALVSAQCR